MRVRLGVCYNEVMEKRGAWRKVLAGLLYGVAALFFVISYFGMTTSGEDIYQGANTEPAILEDMGAAFLHNARLPDMYAWSVINFFDYQFSFGADTIFRLIDVVLGVGVLYLVTYFVLGRKLKLELSDATIFATGFLMLFLTPHGRPLYAGFSTIHNYLPIAMITLGFTTPYLRRLMGREVRERWWLAILMLVFGVGFGMSSNLTPVAFLVTWVIVLIVRLARKEKMRVWEILGVVGILIGMGISYIGGPGVSSYINSEYATTYDYVGLGEIFAAPASSIVRVAKHTIYNAGRVVLPAVILLGVVAGIRLLVSRERRKLAWLPKEKETRRLLAVLGIFIVFHVLAAVQIKAPLRILLPAYLATMIFTLIVVAEWVQGWKIGVVSGVVGALVLVVIGMRTALAIEYHEQTRAVLEKVRSSDEVVVCVSREEVRSRVLPVIYLGQDDMLADWAMPEKIYGKDVVWCGE